ncbi:MAG: hypothetical protein OEW06_16685, partial [Gemmatimonadota bacterium]|nr:hypothetical protein [Gemmatimonadota bacterium]
RAEVVLTLGPGVGTYRVQASPTDAPSAAVVLTATATPAPQLASVTPSSFEAGDTLILDGSGLAAGAEVTVAGAPARVLGGSATSVTLIAPRCLVAGAVEIRARVSGATSNALSASYTSSLTPVALAVGEYASINPVQLAGCATFPAAGADTVEYLVAPQSAAGVPGVSAEFSLAGDSVVIVAQPVTRRDQTPLPFAMRFHDALRRQEAEAARRPRPLLSAAQLAPAEAPSVKVGDTRTFQVCNNIPCSSTSDFAAVTGRAEYVGDHAALFVDQASPSGSFTAADLAALGARFDDDLYGVATTAFGAESDVDQNGVTIILFSPQVNQLTPESQCATSIITGYFFGIDIDPGFQADRRSNRGEVFYAIAPDPSGSVTCTLSTDVVRRLVPVTFIHEFQHMISYFQHVMVRNSDSEVLWLNEGMSHISEELAALHFEAQGLDTLFSRFAIGDLYNAYLYLLNPGAVFTLPLTGTGSLEERGAAWLFLRWVLDQYGAPVTRRLVETAQTGSANVVTAVGVPFDELVSQWFLANWVSDLPGFTAPGRLTFTTWRLRTTYGGLNQSLPSRFTRPFPIEPAVASPKTVRLDGTLHAGSGEYLRLQQVPGEKGFTLRMTGPGGATLPASVVPRLNVIRVR